MKKVPLKLSNCLNFLKKPFGPSSLNSLPYKSKFSFKGTTFSNRPTYLDNLSTSRIDPRVLDSMLPYLNGQFGNPGSRTHHFGWESEEAVSKARNSIANLLNCRPNDLIFTSGATESNNLAIKGFLDSLVSSGETPSNCELITMPTEHKAVLDVFRKLETQGFKVHYLKPNPDGTLDLDILKKALNSKTKLVSIMHVNNEIGIIQDIKKIGNLISDFNEKEHSKDPSNRIVFHSDIAQSFGKLKIDCKDLNIDLMSISAHKIYGPKGVGALYINSKPSFGRRIRISPIQIGGGQERGIRSGTVSTPLVVGLGKAAELAENNMDRDNEHIERLSRKLKTGILKEEGSHFNGSIKNHYPGCNNFSFDYVEGEGLIIGLKDLAISTGSACTSASLEPSYVLKALGVDDELAHTSLRFGISRFTTDKEVENAIKLTNEWVKKLKEVSPLYEMAKEGIDLKSIEWAE